MPETGPDLTYATEVVESLMDDECVITRDSDGVSDDVLDADGNLTPVGSATTLYEGVCMVRPVQAIKPHPVPYTEQQVSQYAVKVPVTVDVDYRKGDVVSITSSRRDPQLVGRTLYVRVVQYRTFALSRTLLVELQQ